MSLKEELMSDIEVSLKYSILIGREKLLYIYRKAKKMVPMIGKVLCMEENVTLMSL